MLKTRFICIANIFHQKARSFSKHEGKQFTCNTTLAYRL